MNASAMLDLVVRNARVATAGDIFEADIGVREGRIVALAQGLPAAVKEIDAGGRWVLPGGVDAHCHLAQPTSDGSRMADDFLSGTRSAACGGTTTVIPFAAQMKGQSLAQAVSDYHAAADGQACIDYAFHMIVSDATPHVVQTELPALIGQGYTSFKIYMTYDDMKLDDGQILDVLDVARREGAMTMIHAESSDCIAWLTERLLARGLQSPRYHALSRPPVVEREATHRAISLAELLDTPILIVHVSGPEATDQIRWAQTRGLSIYAETCPQYLFLTAADLEGEGMHGARCICSPPPRDAASQQAIWNGLANGTFQVFSSDHAPFRYDDPQGKQAQGPDTPFNHVPNGIPGLETRLALLFSEGVLEDRIDINTFVALTSTNPAKLYGLYPRKGTIAIGADADMVIWDTGTPHIVRNTDLHHEVDYTPYEGRQLQAWPAITLSRGKVVYENGVYLGQAGVGRFLHCEKPVPARATRSRHRHLPWLAALTDAARPDTAQP
ncbi:MULTISPECIES: dihydropyrimidinase [unclassified Achromobacter]|uniref:dihydropyrimidinase n=1 Tax=unclassified Achromobacter TaxID=2626865 RepID=UPI000B51CDAD|nr:MULTISPECIES: dihydropyrimidinase [unclassified Achromobacter]OWT75686.1 dihydropyrimidinase [Achromobacter sp. HZ28]OWT76347.1 dihydropyrimidinase [Achromobacter sp. HZ34]